MAWRLRPARLDDKSVWAVPAGKAGTTVIGWIQQTPGGWRRYPPEHDPAVYPHPEQAILDLIEHTQHAR